MTAAEARVRSHSPVQALEVRLGETSVGVLTHLGNEALNLYVRPNLYRGWQRPPDI